MYEALDYSVVTDNSLLGLALKASVLADEDGSSEFDDIAQIKGQLEDATLQHGVLTMDSSMRALYVRLMFAEARLRGRKAFRDGLGREVCPYDQSISELGGWETIQRRAWMDGFRSGEPTFAINASEPDDSLRLVDLIVFPVQSRGSFSEKLDQWSKENSEFGDAIRDQLARIAAQAAMAKRRWGGGIKSNEMLGSENYPGAIIKYRITNRFVEALDFEPQLHL